MNVKQQALALQVHQRAAGSIGQQQHTLSEERLVKFHARDALSALRG